MTPGTWFLLSLVMTVIMGAAHIIYFTRINPADLDSKTIGISMGIGAVTALFAASTVGCFIWFLVDTYA